VNDEYYCGEMELSFVEADGNIDIDDKKLVFFELYNKLAKECMW